MSKKEGPLEYYEIGSAGSHVFTTRIIDYVVHKIAKANKIGYYALLSSPIRDAADIAPLLKGQLVDSSDIFPLAAINYIRNEVSGNRMLIQNGFREGLWKFTNVTKHPVFLCCYCLIIPDFERTYVPFSFIAAHNGNEAAEFLGKYHQVRNAANQGAVLNIVGDRILHFRTIDWDQIVLKDGLVPKIQNEIASFFRSSDIYHKRRLSWRRGVLLTGASGNGKTAICRAIASTSNVPVVHCGITNPDVFSILQATQHTIVKNAPCIALFDDIDILATEEVGKSVFLNMLDGMLSMEGVFCVATATNTDSLDSSFTGRPSRFDSLYVLNNPGEKERLHILKQKLGSLHASKPELQAILKGTDGMSAACVQEVAVTTLLRTPKKITVKDIYESIKKVQEHIKFSKQGTERNSKGYMGFQN